MEDTLRHHLTTCADEFARLTKREPSTVARLATGDWRFYERIEAGASFTARKYDAVMAWFSGNWPADAEWPVGVPRPTFQPANDTLPHSKAA
ncbi:hypothetical protein [Brevundimonas sp. FT23028]|uniref:hypothetical protein n=1 Tax=Brevundimonas sp. FT23028 TaxID=3393748 RepID=UPI003B58631A